MPSLLLTVVCLAGAGLLTQVPELIPRLPDLPCPSPWAVLGSLGVMYLVLSILQLNRGRRDRKELDASTRPLQEIFARHLSDSSVSQGGYVRLFELRMGEFLRLCGAIEKSEETLRHLDRGDRPASAAGGITAARRSNSSSAFSGSWRRSWNTWHPAKPGGKP